MLSPLQHLAHWTISERTIHVVLLSKATVLRHEKPFPTGTLGDLLQARRKQAGMTREQLSKNNRYFALLSRPLGT
jgi:hypothetical protein